MAVLCDLLVCHAFREALLCAGLPCCIVRWGGRGMNGKQTQERRFMWACSVAAIVLCCSRAVLHCALCACSWALGVHCCVLLYYRYALVLWCALRCVLHFSAVRCAASCCAMCVFCSIEQLHRVVFFHHVWLKMWTCACNCHRTVLYNAMLRVLSSRVRSSAV